MLAITSHVPHLIAYNIVGTAHDLEKVTEGEVIKYSAGGFRDFTRIAASDPTMWRDVFLNNRDAVLEVLGRFNEDLSQLQRAVRDGDGEALFDLFTRTRAIRRAIVGYRPGHGDAQLRARSGKVINKTETAARAGAAQGSNPSCPRVTSLDWMCTGPLTIAPPLVPPRHDGVHPAGAAGQQPGKGRTLGDLAIDFQRSECDRRTGVAGSFTSTALCIRSSASLLGSRRM